MSDKKSLDEKIQNDITALLQIGCRLETAAKYAGCPIRHVRRELKENPLFAQRVQRAEEWSEVFFLRQIKKAAEKEQYWRAAAWALERRIPNRYASRGAETMTIDDIREIFRKMAEIVISEVTLPEDRKRIATKINALLADLASGGEKRRRKKKEGTPSDPEGLKRIPNLPPDDDSPETREDYSDKSDS